MGMVHKSFRNKMNRVIWDSQSWIRQSRYKTNLLGVRICDYDTKRFHGFAKQIRVFTNLFYYSRILSNK